jgi:arylformamidase
MEIIDITLPLQDGVPCWPSSAGFKLTQVADMECGDVCNASQIACDVHIGTHVDAPLHFVKGAKSVEQLDLSRFVGPAVVAHISDGDESITRETLARLGLPAGIKRLLLRTRNSSRRLLEQKEFQTDFVALTDDAAAWLVDAGVELIGIDYLSIQRFHDGPRTHQVLLGAGVVVVEGLNLVNAPAGEFELICLPMKLVGSDGAPVRAILRR